MQKKIKLLRGNEIQQYLAVKTIDYSCKLKVRTSITNKQYFKPIIINTIFMIVIV